LGRRAGICHSAVALAAKIKSPSSMCYQGLALNLVPLPWHGYLKILDNTFLFNVVADPLECANLKERHKDIYERLVSEWTAWNATMLPETPTSSTSNFTGADMADHIGMKRVTLDPDPNLR
jgi:hypothetical protein